MPGAAPRLMQSFTRIGSSAASETLGATVEDDAARMGKEIAASLQALFADQG